MPQVGKMMLMVVLIAAIGLAIAEGGTFKYSRSIEPLKRSFQGYTFLVHENRCFPRFLFP
jgi:hypothetical protein